MISRIAVLVAVFAVANASILPLINTGVSSSIKKQDGLGNYAFSYGIADGVGATNSRSESGDIAGNKIGSYTLTDIDGRARKVSYVADAAGFRASVSTNEPGTALSTPAAAVINSPYAPPIALSVPAIAPMIPTIASGVSALSPMIPAIAPGIVGHGAILGAPGIIGNGAILGAPGIIGNGAILGAPGIIGNGAILGAPGFIGAGIIGKSLIL